MTRAAFDWENSIAWSGPGTIDGVQDTLAGDRLDRARYAEFLTNYLATEGKQRNYVLNLNAEWGAGKTWFIKRWYMELKQHYPTVYIDAWQQDFSDDPLLTVISSIIEQLRDAAGNKLAVPDGIKSKLLGLLKIGGKLVLKSAIKKAGLEDGDFSMEGEDADKLVDTLCSNHKERYESIQYLKTEIRQWVEGAVGLSYEKLDYPAFILIDELDRCRPSYAVEMLETIKHIFDIPGVVFVLATDTEQLQHAVKVIYGDGFDAPNYLGRFFNRRFTMPIVSKENFIDDSLKAKKYGLDKSYFWPEDKAGDFLVRVITLLSEVHGISLRRIEQLVDRVIAILNNYLVDAKVNLAFIIFLCVLYEMDPSIYKKIIEGKLSISKGGAEPSLDELFRSYGETHLTVQLNPRENIPDIIPSPDGFKHVSVTVFKNQEYKVSLLDMISPTYSYLIWDKYVESVGHDLYRVADELNRVVNIARGKLEMTLAMNEQTKLCRDMQVYRNLIELAVHIE